MIYTRVRSNIESSVKDIGDAVKVLCRIAADIPIFLTTVMAKLKENGIENGSSKPPGLEQTTLLDLVHNYI